MIEVGQNLSEIIQTIMVFAVFYLLGRAWGN